MDKASIRRLSERAALMREDRASIQREYQEENSIATFSKNAMVNLMSLARMPKNENQITSAMKEMESEGYHFDRKKGKSKTEPYLLKLQNVHDIAVRLGKEPHSALGKKAFVTIMQNLKGGVGKSMATNLVATGAIMMDELMLRQYRVLIVDLDPQATSTEATLPDFEKNEHDLTSIDCLLDDYSREELLAQAVKKTGLHNLSVITCNTADAFNIGDLSNDAIRDEHNANELLKKRIIEPLQYDFDIILLDCGPHLDLVMKNAIAAANGIFVPVPPTFYSFQSSMTFLGRLHEVIDGMVADGMDLNNLKFIKGFVTKDGTHIAAKNKKHASMLVTTVADDLKEVFGRHNVLSHSLKDEEPYERSVEYGCTIFTMQKKQYVGSDAAFNRAYKEACNWVKDVIIEIVEYQKEID